MERNEKQIRKLRELADKARQAGNSRRALEVYHELCQADPTEPRWPQLCGELHRKLGQLEESLEHFVTAAQIYRDQGFDVKAVAMCKVVLGLDPLSSLGLNLLEEITATPRLAADTVIASPQSYTRLPAIAPTDAAREAGSPQAGMPRDVSDFPRAAQPAGPRPTTPAAPSNAPSGLEPEPGDPFSPIHTATPSRSIGVPVSAPFSRIPPASGQAPAPNAPAPRHFSKETSPRELQALNLSELDALLQPTAGMGDPGSQGATPSPSQPSTPPPSAERAAPAHAARSTLDLAIEIEGFDSVLGSSPVSSASTSRSVESPAAPRSPRRQVQETLTLSEDELEILESGTLTLGGDDDDAVVVVEPPKPEPSPYQPTRRRPAQPTAPSEEELEILDDSDLAFMEALEQSTTGEQRQPKRRPTLTPNAPLESLELKDVMPRLERLPSQPHMDELYEIALSEPETPPAASRPVETADYERRLTPAKPPPDMTPPGLFRALGIDATKSLVTRMNFVEKKPGEVVIQQGDVGGSLYVIVRGEVRIVKELGAQRVEVSRLGEGEFFGEMALVTDTPRVATVEAVTELDLLEVTRETLRLLIQDFPQVVPNLIKFLKDRLLEVFVKTSDLLGPVPEKYRWQLARKFKLYEIHEGKTILREGKPTGGIFIFLAGQAVATRQRRGRILELAELGPGSLIGELSLLGGGDAMATVTAKTKCWLLAVSQKQFEVLCQSFPQMRSIVEQIAEQRRQENAKLLSGDLSFVSQELRLV